MIKTYLFSVILLCVLIASCKKEETPSEPIPCEPTITQVHSYDTIYPSEYFMAYPGSWWEYDNGLIDSCRFWQEVAVNSTTSSDGCLFVEEDMLVLPERLNFHQGHLHFDHTVTTADELSASVYVPLYDSLSGWFWGDEVHGGEGQFSYRIEYSAHMMSPLDSMEVGGTTYFDIIHVKYITYKHFFHLGSGPGTATERYFAKDVGLIKWVTMDNNGLVEDVELVDYFIGPH